MKLHNLTTFSYSIMHYLPDDNEEASKQVELDSTDAILPLSSVFPKQDIVIGRKNGNEGIM